MAPKLQQGVTLAASIGERMKASGLVKFHRPSPPSAQRIASVHQIKAAPAVPDQLPEETTVEPMAKKKKGARFDAAYKARIVARVLKAKDTGSETVSGIATAEGISTTNIYNWVSAAKAKGRKAAKKAPKSVKRKRQGKAPDIASLSKDLSEAISRVTAIKKQLRVLLDVD